MYLLLLLLLFFIAITVYYSWYNSCDYWFHYGIIGPKSFKIFGNMLSFCLGREPYGNVYERIYNEYPKLHYVGIYRLFNEPALLARSQAMVKEIMLRSFTNFENNVLYVSKQRDPIIVHNPFVACDEQWRQMRAEFLPNFTPNKLKHAFPHIATVCSKLENFIAHTLCRRERFEAKELCTRYTLDVVASVGFGLDGQCLKMCDTSKSELCELLEQLFQPNAYSLLDTIALLHSPHLGHIIQYRYVPLKLQQWLRSVVGHILKQRFNDNDNATAAATAASTAAATADIQQQQQEKQQLKQHNDFVQWLIEARQRAQLPIDATNIVGHCSTFLLEGYETSATLMAFALYEYARHELVQQRLQTEIDEVLARYNGELCAEAVASLHYLEATLYETLRLYPAMMALLKRCTKAFELPLQHVTDNEQKLNSSSGGTYTVPPGMIFVVPVKAIHYDAAHFPEPKSFKPERFATQAERQRLGCCFLGFGEGPRMCPGMRFGLAQSKAALATILHKYNVSLAVGAPCVELSATTFLTASKNGIWLRLIPRIV